MHGSHPGGLHVPPRCPGLPAFVAVCPDATVQWGRHPCCAAHPAWSPFPTALRPPTQPTSQRAKTEPLSQACGFTSQSFTSPHRLHVKRSCGRGGGGGEGAASEQL